MQISIINTGGTFNKYYDPIKGSLAIYTDDTALKPFLATCANLHFDIHNILAKDSLDMTDADRQIILATAQSIDNDKVIIIHGTDTIDQTARFLAKSDIPKQIVLTAAMVPASIDSIEAGFNLALALGFLNAKSISNDIYIAMHGVVVTHQQIAKNKQLGQFLLL